MRLMAKSTTKIVQLAAPGEQVKARIWEATTEGGVRCHLHVTRIAVALGEDQREFEQELHQEHDPMSAAVQAIPLRLIL